MPAKPSALVDTRVIYCGDNLEQLRKLPDGCVDLVYIDPPFNSNSVAPADRALSESRRISGKKVLPVAPQ
jgi:16S rRNA G966 N2-methylase RsmD